VSLLNKFISYKQTCHSVRITSIKNRRLVIGRWTIFKIMDSFKDLIDGVSRFLECRIN
jgi:hypothetical protein